MCNAAAAAAEVALLYQQTLVDVSVDGCAVQTEKHRRRTVKSFITLTRINYY